MVSKLEKSSIKFFHRRENELDLRHITDNLNHYLTPWEKNKKTFALHLLACLWSTGALGLAGYITLRFKSQSETPYVLTQTIIVKTELVKTIGHASITYFV